MIPSVTGWGGSGADPGSRGQESAATCVYAPSRAGGVGGLPVCTRVRAGVHMHELFVCAAVPRRSACNGGWCHGVNHKQWHMLGFYTAPQTHTSAAQTHYLEPEPPSTPRGAASQNYCCLCVRTSTWSEWNSTFCFQLRPSEFSHVQMDV